MNIRPLRALGAALCIALLVGVAPVARANPEQPCTCAGPSASSGRAPLDLNTASEAALLELPGIGPSRARAILAFRATHGRFRSVSQLLAIKGIGRALLKQLRPLVTVSSGPA